MNKLLMTIVLGFMSVSANALTFDHIQSKLIDYGRSTSSFGGFLAQSEQRYNIFADLLKEGGHTLESAGFVGLPTDKELNDRVEEWRNANDGSTRTVGLNSLFQVSDNTLLQLKFQLNTGYNSKALKVNPSVRLGFTIATQLTNDDSFTFTLSPKLLAGGKVFENRTNLLGTLDKELGKVSNGTTMRLEYTHKF